MFKNAIVRQPCREIINGLSSAKPGKPEYQKALEQHKRYTETLRECGLIVQSLAL
jgi:dimethylargininase